MIEITSVQARLDEIKEELDWEVRLVRSGMPRWPNEIFELRLEAHGLEQTERIWIMQAEIGALLG